MEVSLYFIFDFNCSCDSLCVTGISFSCAVSDGDRKHSSDSKTESCACDA
jgi:hypothetical protein